jgi:hypothetical protein
MRESERERSRLMESGRERRRSPMLSKLSRTGICRSGVDRCLEGKGRRGEREWMMDG